jgi:hypothetical protein
VVHEFTPGWIQTTWRVHAPAGHAVDVLFPSWGRRASVTAASGAEVRDRRPLDGIEWLYVRGARSGYVIVPVAPPHGAGLRLLHPAPQGSAPSPGPTLAVRLPGRHRRSLTVRIATVRAGADPAAIAAELRSVRR